jgi:hypothetical protein
LSVEGGDNQGNGFSIKAGIFYDDVVDEDVQIVVVIGGYGSIEIEEDILRCGQLGDGRSGCRYSA